MAGNSLGGYITWSFAVKHPDLVKKIILVDSAGYLKQKSVFVFWIVRTPIIGSMLKYFTPRPLIKMNVEDVYGDDSKITDAIVDRYYELNLRAGNRDAFQDRAKLVRIDNSSKISQVKVPTLIVWGSKDNWIPPGHADRFTKDIKGSKLIIYEGAGHIPMEEIPLETAKDAKEFLQDNR
ncbi:MAG: alpha/beta hydrolase [Proteobacteria bacterium]|nr:alpha/beta hydrolase [Pseudomonadota bacterium]